MLKDASFRYYDKLKLQVVISCRLIYYCHINILIGPSLYSWTVTHVVIQLHNMTQFSELNIQFISFLSMLEYCIFFLQILAILVQFFKSSVNFFIFCLSFSIFLFLSAITVLYFISNFFNFLFFSHSILLVSAKISVLMFSSSTFRGCLRVETLMS